MLKIMLPLLSLALMTKTKNAQYHSMIVMSLLGLISLKGLAIPNQFFNELTFSDSLNTPLVILSLWITMLMTMASMKLMNSSKSPSMFLMTTTLLCATLLMTFWSSSFLSFYLFFEASLIPTTILILTWGYQPERLQASFYLMLYTVFASLPLLLSIIMVASKNNHLLMIIPMMSCPSLMTMKMWWIITIMAFLAKMPIYGLHLWLPKAHVEAPVSGSMILAGILLKLGGYGLLRMAFSFQQINMTLSSLLISLTLLGAIIASIICIRQTDLKSLIAYSSVSHMGLMTASLMTNSSWAWQGTLMMMIAHGLSSSGLFAAANMTYEATHTRSLFLTKGLLNLFPALTMGWFLLTAANMAVPPSINLMSEIMLITSLTNTSYWTIPSLIIITFMGGAYSLHLYTASQHGTPPTFLAPMNMPVTRNIHTLMLHIIPIFILILSPEVISSWL